MAAQVMCQMIRLCARDRAVAAIAAAALITSVALQVHAQQRAQNKTAKPGNTSEEAPPSNLFDMAAIRDASTLDVRVLKDWHPVDGRVPTRQKLIDIHVGELWPGQELRMPVRMTVPADSKARGFHLTGSHTPDSLKRDTRLNPTDQTLIRGGVGMVETVVQDLGRSGLQELGRRSEERFLRTLDPRDKIQYWAWPATLMRAVTAAYAEKEHFERGKVALSGGSKNGASPSMAIIHDNRMTAVWGSVSPIWDSPLRLNDRKAWDELEAQAGRMDHPFLGGHFGPIFNRRALAAGHSWEELEKFAADVSDDVFISRNLESLRERGVDMLFHPGTHDFVAFDLAWGGAHHPTIPLYLRANSGHGKKGRHPGVDSREQNLAAFLLTHFLDSRTPMLKPPQVEHSFDGRTLTVTVRFEDPVEAETGRIWWMYDRPIDGSPGYLNELIPDGQWGEMSFDRDARGWVSRIITSRDAGRIDFFTTHRKAVRVAGQSLQTYISCPYTRVQLKP